MVRSSNSSSDWKDRETPAPGRRRAGQCVMSVGPTRTVPLLGADESRDGVDDSRLAGAVGPDESVDLPGANLEVDVLHRVNPSEGDGQPGHVQRHRFCPLSGLWW